MKFIKDNGHMFGSRYSYGSGITCKYASKDKHYVKVLAACRTKHMTMKEIYPSVKHPIPHEVVTLCKLGLLQRYTQPKYLKTVECDTDRVFTYPTRVWYKTTAKGRKLLAKVGL